MGLECTWQAAVTFLLLTSLAFLSKLLTHLSVCLGRVFLDLDTKSEASTYLVCVP
jgi:hypothetical protein